MEIRAYFKIFARFWWIIVLCVVAAGGGSFVLSKIKQPTYSTATKFIIHPAPTIEDPRAVIDLVGQLGNRYIAGGYAQAVTSDEVKQEAQSKVGLLTGTAANPVADRTLDAANYTIEANIEPDTTVVQVRGTGPDPQILTSYVNATAEATITNTKDLFSVLEVLVIDDAQVPTDPISPQPSRDVPVGFGLGLAVGVLLAIALDYLLVPVSAAPKPEEPTEPEGAFMRPPLRRMRPN